MRIGFPACEYTYCCGFGSWSCLNVVRTLLRRTAPRLGPYHEVCLRHTLRLQHVKQPRKVSLLQCLQHWSPTLAEGVEHCIADAWASSSCERTVPSQVCAWYIDIYDNNIPLLHLDGETTMWITTTSEPDCRQLNQRHTTCYMDPPHNCNVQLYIPTVSQPRTDVTGLSDMWGTKKRKRMVSCCWLGHIQPG